MAKPSIAEFSFSESYDHAYNQLRAIKSIGLIQSSDDSLEECHVTAADHVAALANDCLETMEHLWKQNRAEFERRSEPVDATREWNGNTVDAEEKALPRSTAAGC